jgi:hypothetical protein
LNLKTEQRRYKVFIDDSYEAEKEPGKTFEQWRYYELRGKYGSVYPYSETDLAMCVTSPKIAGRIRREMPDWPVIQSGDEETVFKVANSTLFSCAEAIQAKKRRVISPATRERLARIGFRPAKSS